MLISAVAVAAVLAGTPAHTGTTPAPLHLWIPEARMVVRVASRQQFASFTETRLRVRATRCHHIGPLQVVCDAAIKGDRIDATFRVRIHRLRPVYRIVMGHLVLV